MAFTTVKKVRFLQEYITEWAEKLIAMHCENISGIRIDKKWTGRHKKIQYAIVFQVANKLDKTELEESQIIPEYFDILFPDGIERRIKTDIHETGTFSFQTHIGDKVLSTHSYEFGSMGLFVNDFSANTYAVTNYHVVAKTLVDGGQFFYERDPSQTTPDVTITDTDGSIINGIFDLGAINTDVDVAFVQVNRTPDIMNQLPGTNSLNGAWDRPKVLAAKGKAVRIFSFYSQGGGTTINNTAVSINDPSTGIVFSNLIQLSAVVTHSGDSGGLAVDELNTVIGIVVGADNYASYLLPFYKIANFKRCYPI